MTSRPCLILASSSPRRLALLAQLTLVPDLVLPAEIDETARKGELPRDLAARLSAAKAATIAKHIPNEQTAFILAADTIVHLGRRILPKAQDDKMVQHCLQLLSGRRHRVTTSVSLMKITADAEIVTRHRVVETVVAFKRLHRDEITAYVESGEGIGKAGGYAIQGRAAGLISSTIGSYSNVVGLPLYETRALLMGLGWQGI